MSLYLTALTHAMKRLARDPRTVFVGQSVAYPGQRAHGTFASVPQSRRIEMPIAEDLQVGFCCGLALAGWVPLSFVPRLDFLILAANAIVNHLDVLPGMGWRPHVIIRTAVGSSYPMDPGPQHTRDHADALRAMCRNVEVITIESSDGVLPAYERAMAEPGGYIIIERMALY